MTKKELLLNNPKLYKSFQDQAKRLEIYRTYVYFGDFGIHTMRFAEDRDAVNCDFLGYSETALEVFQQKIDHYFEECKSKWIDIFKWVDQAGTENDKWLLDMTNTDYVVLIIDNARYYRLPWSRDGLRELMESLETLSTLSEEAIGICIDRYNRVTAERIANAEK